MTEREGDPKRRRLAAAGPEMTYPGLGAWQAPQPGLAAGHASAPGIPMLDTPHLNLSLHPRQSTLQHMKLMIEAKEKQEEKKRMKRAANRRSACTSRLRKKQCVSRYPLLARRK